MTQSLLAIFEDGVFKPLEVPEFAEHQQVRLTVESVELETGNGNAIPQPPAEDPLAGLRIATGIPDLADRFDDYRFGRKSR